MTTTTTNALMAALMEQETPATISTTTTSAWTERNGVRSGYINWSLLTGTQTADVLAYIADKFGVDAAAGTTKLQKGSPLHSKVPSEMRIQAAFKADPSKVILAVGTYHTAERALPEEGDMADI